VRLTNEGSLIDGYASERMCLSSFVHTRFRLSCWTDLNVKGQECFYNNAPAALLLLCLYSHLILMMQLF
jgi:hypothetical protein